MRSGASAQRVLIAGTEEAVRLLTDVLAGDLEIVCARSVREALQRLTTHGPFHYVVCNVSFDESRMFDFLQALRAAELQPPPRVVCVHAKPSALSPRARPAIEAALEALGVHALVDFAELVAVRGELAARQILRTTILAKP